MEAAFVITTDFWFLHHVIRCFVRTVFNPATPQLTIHTHLSPVEGTVWPVTLIFDLDLNRDLE